MSNMAIDYRPILDGKQRREILHLGFENYAKYTLGYDAEQAAALANKTSMNMQQNPGQDIQTGKMSYSVTVATRIMK